MTKALCTLPHAVEHTLHSLEAPQAFNYRLNETWHPMSAKEFLRLAQNFAMGLHSLGIRKGDTVGIIENSSPFWLIADMGILMAGGVSVPMFNNISDDNLSYEIKDSGIDYIVVDSEESLSRTLNHQEILKSVIACFPLEDPPFNVLPFDRLVERGKALNTESPQILSRLMENLQEADIATIIYTSGSTGVPKGVELTHGNLLSQIQAAGERFPLHPNKDRAISCLPLAHVFERMVMYYYVISGVSCYYVDDIKKVGQYLKEVRPTTMTMVPRLMEKLYAKLREKADDAPFPRKQIARWAISRALKCSVRRTRNTLDRIADKLVYRKFRDGLGGNFTRIIVGGASVPPRLQRFFINIGMPVYVGYGLTESSPVLAANYDGHNKIGTVGPAFPGVELRVSENGEILARGPNIMRGYHNARSATDEVIDHDGWLHTGDLGHLDRDGYLVIDGRAKELLKTSTGKYISPIPIEQALCESSLIDMSMVIAEGKPFATSFLFLDPACLEQLKVKMNSTSLSDEKFSKCDAVRELIQIEIDRVNESLNEWEKVRAYETFIDPPSIEKEEMTPTMKIKRHAIEKKRHGLINALYSAHKHSLAFN